MNKTYGFILAAGLGTRLRPLTDDRPKALVEVDGHSLLEWNMHRLIDAGVDAIVVNVFHFAEKMIQFIQSRDWAVPVYISDERPEVLETGGGLIKALEYMDDADNVLVWNVDIFCDVNIELAYETFVDEDADALLLCSKRTSTRKLLWENNQLVGWKNLPQEEYRWVSKPVDDYQERAFSGIHFIKKTLLQEIQQEGKFSIIHSYLQLAQDHRIMCFDHSDTPALDLGKPETLAKGEDFLAHSPYYQI